MLFIFCYFTSKIKNMNEIWINIKGYESTHQISNLGRLKIKGRTYINGLGITKRVSEKIKTPNEKRLVSVNGHPFDIRTLLLRHFPEEYTNKFILSNTLPNEEWRDIKGYEGYYKISSLGRVMSLPRITGTKTLSRGEAPICTLGSILTLNRIGKVDKSGFFRVGVTLHKDGVSCIKLVNRLVAEAFIPNPKNLPEVNHKNRDVLDNSVGNLEWVSSEFNIQHALLSRESLIALYNLSNKKGLPPSDMLLKLISNYTD